MTDESNEQSSSSQLPEVNFKTEHDFSTQDAVERDREWRTRRNDPAYFAEQMAYMIEQKGSLPENFAEKLNEMVDKIANEARFNAMNAVFDEMARRTSASFPSLPERPSNIQAPVSSTQEYFGKNSDTPPTLINPFNSGEPNLNTAPTQSQQESTR